jgi:hypothetical protein
MPKLIEGSALDQQLHLFEQQALRLGEEAGSDDLGSVVSLGLALFQQIHRMEDRTATTIEGARRVANHYSNWYRAAKTVRNILKSKGRIELEALAAEFDDACRHARVPAVHFDDLLQLEARGG